MGKKAGVYVRISLDRTGQEAGVKRQEEDCRKLAASKGWEIVEVFSDNDVSASNGAKRAAYDQLLQALKDERIQAVVVWHTDRLYRRLDDLEDLINVVEQKKASIATVKAGDIDLTNASGRMQARILASVAKHETERTAERVARWHEDRAAKGLPHGGGKRPYGYDWDAEAGTWRIRKEEAAVIRRIVRDLLSGRSLSGIVRSLNLEGVKTANGSRWANGTVSRLVKTPTIAGLRVHKRTGTTTKGNWKGIITPTQRELLLALFNDPTRPKRGGGPTERKRLLSGLLVCSKCGSKMYGDGQKAYACHKSWKGCGNLRIASSPLEDWVTWEATRHLARLREAGWVTDIDPEEEDTQQLVDERLLLQQRRDDWAHKLALGEVDDHAYAVGLKAIDARLDELQTKLAAAVKQEPAPIDDADIDIVFAPVAGENWTAMLSPKELLERYELLAQLIERIVVSPASRRGARWEPDRVEIAWKHPDPPTSRAPHLAVVH